MSDASENQPQDNAFADRINELVATLNKQAESADVADVADSAIYAAARYLVFAHATQYESREKFDGTRDEAMEHFLKVFREILSDNMDEYSEGFPDGASE